jgi:OmpA family protein
MGVSNNIDLSSRRAANIAAYFRSQGVNPNILSAKGFGEARPIAPNDTPQSRAQNRRIEIILERPGAYGTLRAAGFRALKTCASSNPRAAIAKNKPSGYSASISRGLF